MLAESHRLFSIETILRGRMRHYKTQGSSLKA